MKPLLALAVLSVVACSGPESTRTRGGGPGGDVGNRPAAVRMHEGSQPYHGTPRLVSVAPPPLDTARHASEPDRVPASAGAR